MLPPITAYAATIAGTSRDALTNREASLQRIRAMGTERGSGSAAIRLPDHSAPRRGGSSRRGGRGRGGRNPPNAFRSLPIGGDQEGSSTSHQSQNRTPPCEFLVILLPFKVQYCPSPTLPRIFTITQVVKQQQEAEVVYRFTLADVSQVVPQLQEHGLTCRISLPQAGEVWRPVEQQILDHLRNQDISAGVAPNRAAGSYFTSPLLLVHPTKGRQATQRPFVESDLTASTFTVAELRKKSQLVNNPIEGARDHLLFFGNCHAWFAVCPF